MGFCSTRFGSEQPARVFGGGWGLRAAAATAKTHMSQILYWKQQRESCAFSFSLFGNRVTSNRVGGPGWEGSERLNVGKCWAEMAAGWPLDRVCGTVGGRQWNVASMLVVGFFRERSWSAKPSRDLFVLRDRRGRHVRRWRAASVVDSSTGTNNVGR